MPTQHSRAWRRNLITIVIMLAIWLAVTVLPIWYADALDAARPKSPRAYWVAAYGAPLVYLVLIGIYAMLMRSNGARR